MKIKKFWVVGLLFIATMALTLVACGGGGGSGDDENPFLYTSLRGSAPAGTRIVIEGTGLSATVDASGQYEIRDVPNGTYRCTATLGGRRDSITFTWTPGEWTKIDWNPRL